MQRRVAAARRGDVQERWRRGRLLRQSTPLRQPREEPVANAVQRERTRVFVDERIEFARQLVEEDGVVARRPRRRLAAPRADGARDALEAVCRARWMVFSERDGARVRSDSDPPSRRVMASRAIPGC